MSSDDPWKQLLEQAGEPDIQLRPNIAKESNPVLVLTADGDDDDDDGAPIGLGVRQPSFTSLHGPIIPKGATEALQAIEPMIEETNETPQTRNNNNPVVVLTGEDDDDEDGAPIGLSVRQPSFSSLHGMMIPKGGTEGLNSIEPLIEEESVQTEPEKPRGLGQRQSSYANLQMANTIAHKAPASQLPSLSEEREGSNPVLVLTNNEDDDDDDGAPIGLSVRQPSFSSLHGMIIPKGGTTSIDAVIEEEEPEKPQGLGQRQSSYANLQMVNALNNNKSQPRMLPSLSEEEPTAPVAKPKEADNPVLVLTNDNDDDEDGAPIGLSVRQPSFSSLHGMIIPKGGTDGFASMGPLIEEKDEDEEEPRGLGMRQSSYAKLHLAPPPPKDSGTKLSMLQEEGDDEVTTSNPVIVLTGNDNDDDDDGAPIGLSVRQPSFSSLHGMIIPKGGVDLLGQSPILEEVTEEESLPPPPAPSGGSKLGKGPRQSSYSNIRMINQIEDHNSVKASTIQQIVEEPEQPAPTDASNPIIVLTGNDEDDAAPIGLSVRQPSFSSLHGAIIPKGGNLATGFGDIVEEEPETANKPISLTNEGEDVKSQILTSLHKFNKERWEEIGYTPATGMKRNCSYQAFTTNSIMVPENRMNVNRSESYMFGGYNSNKTGIKRVNSADGKRGASLKLEMPSDAEPEKPVQVARGPSLIRVNSFGNRSQLLVVEMPIEDEKEQTSASDEERSALPKLNKIPEPVSMINEQEEFEEEEYLDDSQIPPRLLELVHHSEDSIVYLALCGASVTGYEDKTVNNVIMELKKYLKMCVERHYIDESAYVKEIIDSIRDERVEMKKAAKANQNNYSEKLEMAQYEKSEIEKNWEHKFASLEAERELALAALEDKYEEQCDALDAEWNSDKKRNKFNKPSASLIAMRKTAQRMLAAHKFDDASLIAKKIEQKEQEESEAAVRRMQDAYQTAVNSLRMQHEQEKRAINQDFEGKKNAMIRRKEQYLSPIQNRINNLNGSRRAQERSGSTRQARSISQQSTKTRQSRRTKDVNLGNEKLSLPPLTKYKARPLIAKQ